MLYYSNQTHWLRLIFFSGKTLRRTVPDALVVAVIGLVAFLLEGENVSLAALLPGVDLDASDSEPPRAFVSNALLDSKVHDILVVPLSFLLIFRSNHAYGRFWEGRKLIGALVRAVRNFTRTISVYHTGEGTRAVTERAHMRRLALFAFELAALQLKHKSAADMSDTLAAEAASVMGTPEEKAALQKSEGASVPLILQWLSARIGRAFLDGDLHAQGMRLAEEDVSAIQQAWMGADAIASTPMPYPYVQMLHGLLAIYLYTLPLTLADRFGWLTPVLSFVIAISLLAISNVARELEMPFGTDENDLPVARMELAAANDTLALLAERDPATPHFDGDISPDEHAAQLERQTLQVERIEKAVKATVADTVDGLGKAFWLTPSKPAGRESGSHSHAAQVGDSAAGEPGPARASARA